jgi:branched-subunit amino acid ABC-type transport system permease component
VIYNMGKRKGGSNDIYGTPIENFGLGGVESAADDLEKQIRKLTYLVLLILILLIASGVYIGFKGFPVKVRM